MNQRIQTLPPSTCVRNSNWLFEETKPTKWTPEENKQFEKALALFDKDTPDRWYNVARMIPGKTVNDVIKQYKELEEDVSDIEAGLIPIPGYDRNSFTLEWVNDQGYDGLNQLYSSCGKRGLSSRGLDHERKKGVPWTEEEHRQFLLGLKKYGKGYWRNISHNFVTTRTPTQVASHAQKYFIRQLSGGKDKRRSSIHDITTLSISDTTSPPLDSNKSQSPNRFSSASVSNSSVSDMASRIYNWDPLNQGASTAFNVENSSLVFGTDHIVETVDGAQADNIVLQLQSIPY